MSKKTQEKASEPELTGQQWQCIALLVAGKRQTEIAGELDITAPTISRWKADPVFQAMLNLAVQESFMAVVGKTRAAATMAIDTVIALAQSATDEKTRLSAALQLLRLHSAYDADAPTLPTSAGLIAHEQRQSRTAREIADLANFAFGG